MSYENAPATKMLATNCACCRRPLLDARSVEIGMGPTCRKRNGYDASLSALDEAGRKRANELIHMVAVEGDGMAVLAAEAELRLLGFAKLADTIVERCATVQILPGPGGFWVRTPYSEAATLSFRRIPGRRWNGEAKVNVVPDTRKADLWSLLRAHFPGALGFGAKGPFVVEAR